VTFDERSFPYKEARRLDTPPPQPSVSDGPVTITYNGPIDSDEGPAPLTSALPSLTTTPSQHPTPEREAMEFHTPLSQPAAPTPPQRPRPVWVQRAPEVLPQSALPGPAFGPPCPPSPRCLRENPRPNPHYYNVNTVAQLSRQACTWEPEGELQHAALLNALVHVATAEY